MLDFYNIKVLVAGSGISGNGAKEALLACGAIVYPFEDGKEFIDTDYDLIVISPSFEKTHFLYSYARFKNIPIIGEYALGSIINKKPLVAVTGTNGKTTVTQMLNAVLCRDFCISVSGNIGVSFAAVASKGEYEIAVTEVSSYQLEQTPYLKPKIAIITNITPDHLERHKNMEEYSKIKYSISSRQDESDYLILPYDEYLYDLPSFSTQADTYYVSTKRKVKGAYIKGGNVYFCNKKLFDVSTLKASGEHNKLNMLFAVCAACLLNADKNNIEKGIANFTLDDHRLKLVAQIGGVKFYNDSKSTNADSVIKALNAMDGTVCLIMCGSEKGLEYDGVFDYSSHVVQVNVTGEIANSVIESAKRKGFIDVKNYPSLESAVVSAFLLKPDNVLLSPGSASFDSFSSYIERGNRFEEIVRELAHEK